jgi:hypothetical protein
MNASHDIQAPVIIYTLLAITLAIVLSSKIVLCPFPCIGLLDTPKVKGELPT